MHHKMSFCKKKEIQIPSHTESEFPERGWRVLFIGIFRRSPGNCERQPDLGTAVQDYGVDKLQPKGQSSLKPVLCMIHELIMFFMFFKV